MCRMKTRLEGKGSKGHSPLCPLIRPCGLRPSFFQKKFLFKKLILCKFHIMYPNPTHLPIPPYMPSALQPMPQTKHLHLQMSVAMSPWSVSRPRGICHTFNSVSSLGLLLDIMLLPCAMRLCSLDLHDLPLLEFQQFIDGVDVGVGQLKALDLSLGGS